MRELSSNNLGIIIAYLVPGMIALWGLSAIWPELTLLQPADEPQPTIGGLLCLTVIATGLGVLCGTIRWLVIDTIHHRTGLRPARWDFSRFHELQTGYDRLTSLHYDFYQFHANGLIAIAGAYSVQRVADSGLGVMTDLGIVPLLVVLFLGSRDTLRKYYSRLNQLLEPAHESLLKLGHYSFERDFSISRHRRLRGISRASATF